MDTQPHELALVAPHVSGDAQFGPHETLPPHPFGTVPQLAKVGHVPVGVQPHWCVVPPPPHDCGAAHDTHGPTRSPQPSAIASHGLPA